MIRNICKCVAAAALPLVFGFGCAHGRADRAVEFGDIPEPSTLAVTSDRPVERVYEKTPGTADVTVGTSQSTEQSDWALAEEVRQCLLDHKGLAPYPSDISVDVHGGNGVVTLRGTMQRGADRKRLHDRIASLPGVRQVDDQIVLGVGEPHSSVDIRQDK